MSGSERPLAACTTRVVEGTKIETQAPDLVPYRRLMLNARAERYPPGAPALQLDKEFHNALTGALEDRGSV